MIEDRGMEDREVLQANAGRDQVVGNAVSDSREHAQNDDPQTFHPISLEDLRTLYL